jgi:abortive infection Abi-like protein
MKPPKISQRAISALQRVITGDLIEPKTRPVAPYQSGPKLVAFFNEFGSNDVYPAGGGFPSRWQYVEGKLQDLNGTMPLVRVIEAAVFPARFLDTDFDAAKAVEYLNRYLGYDGYELTLAGKCYRLQRSGERLVEIDSKLEPRDRASHEFIDEQLAKCDRKLQEADYDGAITNARSLIEAVLFELEGRLDPARSAYDGDLMKLYRRVQKAMNLDPSRSDVSDSLRQILSGLVNVIAGLAPLRNKMGDAHVRTHKPERHHAKLAVNAAKTLTDFVIESFEYQKASGKITEIDPVA